MTDRTLPPRPHTYKRPTEVVDGATPSPLRQVAWTALIATLVALALGSKALLNWTNNLPIGPLSDFLLYLAQGWQDAMDSIGVTWFADKLRDLLRALQALR